LFLLLSLFGLEHSKRFDLKQIQYLCIVSPLLVKDLPHVNFLLDLAAQRVTSLAVCILSLITQVAKGLIEPLAVLGEGFYTASGFNVLGKLLYNILSNVATTW
jgi:hypothetical protein